MLATSYVRARLAFSSSSWYFCSFMGFRVRGNESLIDSAGRSFHFLSDDNVSRALISEASNCVTRANVTRIELICPTGASSYVTSGI